MKQQKSMQELRQESYLSGGGDTYLEGLYETYLKEPNQVPPEWTDYFKTLKQNTTDISHDDIRQVFADMAKQRVVPIVTVSGVSSEHQRKQEKVIDLIATYRNLGHLQANIDPLGMYSGIYNPALELSHYGFSDSDMTTTFDVGTYLALGKPSATLNEIYQSLRTIYSGSIGVEYMHMMKLDEVKWIQDRMERSWSTYRPTIEEKKRILDRLVVAEGLEKYLGVKYVGQKRFSLEGGDSLIPMIDTMVEQGAASGLKDIIIGMAHRGRLNVLVNILGKEPKALFAHFENQNIDESSSGDVKYHLGYSSNLKTQSGSVHVALAFNPSHLEIVSPVVQGSVRARQRRRSDADRNLVMPIQIHGDSAFAGQGVVMETFNMSQARWFSVGGSIHIVINNQVGFTTSNPLDTRSGVYCTDIAKMVEAPILHVNGNDPEAVCFAAKLAVDYRAKFKKDIVIDLVCYRRHGHNEADEPSATQPLMYKIIKALPTPASMYANKLVVDGVVSNETEKQLAENYRKKLDEGKSVVALYEDNTVYEFTDAW